jgi:glutamate synthase (NADPH/NADH) large chain
VWDPDGTFASRLNDEMVDLDPLDDLDTSWLVTAIFRHQSETGSEVASRILSDWQYSVPQFVKVMPRDYKRVLGAIKAAEEAGTDIDEAIMAAAKG